MSYPAIVAHSCAESMRRHAKSEIMSAEMDIARATDRRDRAAIDLAGADLMLALLEPAYREQSEMRAATERMMLEDDLSVEG